MALLEACLLRHILNAEADMDKLSFKDKMDIMEAICTIIVSVMAIWGTVVAWENGFWHKLKHIADHVHAQIEMEKKSGASNAISAIVDEIKKEK